MMPFALAWQFLTVLPVPGLSKGNESAFGRSLVFFPAVGLGLGSLVAAADLLFNRLFSPAVASTLTLATIVALTGALHLDGLADTCDGLLAPGRNREERLRIMRDSHLGSYGAAGLVLVLLVKLAAVGALPPPLRVPALVVAPVIGRWAIVYTMVSQPYARSDQGVTAALKAGASPGVLLAATIWTVLSSLLLGAAGPVILVTCAIVVVGLVRLVAGRLGGMTGDTCGAACEVAETLALLLAPVGTALAGAGT